MVQVREQDDDLVYCRCPKCKTIRRKIDGKYTIIKRGKERNRTARFFCTNCGKWFNEKTGDFMKWYKR